VTACCGKRIFPIAVIVITRNKKNPPHGIEKKYLKEFLRPLANPMRKVLKAFEGIPAPS
jgi:hypothetical protein